MKHLCLIITLLFIGCVSPVKKATIDRQIFIAARDAIDDIQHQKTVSGFKYTVDPSKGIITTDWFQTHKGEIQLKITCKVEGENYYITVVQKRIFSKSENTKWAKIYKNNLAEEIKKKLDKK